MDFAFSEDQLLLQQTLRQYAKDKLAPNYHRWDRGEVISRALIKEAAEFGVFGLRVPGTVWWDDGRLCDLRPDGGRAVSG